MKKDTDIAEAMLSKKRIAELKLRLERLAQSWTVEDYRSLAKFYVNILPKITGAERCTIYIIELATDKICSIFGTGLDERLVRLRLEHVGRGETRALVHAMDSKEDEVEVDVAQGADGERPHQGIRGCAHAAGEDDRLVAAAAVIEDLRGRHGVRHDRQAGDLRQAPADLVGRAAGRDGHGHPRLDHTRSLAGDGRIMLQLGQPPVLQRQQDTQRQQHGGQSRQHLHPVAKTVAAVATTASATTALIRPANR